MTHKTPVDRRWAWATTPARGWRRTFLSVVVLGALVAATGYVLVRTDAVPTAPPEPQPKEPPRVVPDLPLVLPVPPAQELVEARAPEEPPAPEEEVEPADDRPAPRAASAPKGRHRPRPPRPGPRQEAAARPATPAPVVAAAGPGTGSYRIRFRSDHALGEVVRQTRAWAYACAPDGTLFLVPPATGRGVSLPAVVVARSCGPAETARLGLVPLDAPTPALLRALGGPAGGSYRWFVRLDRSLTQHVDRLLRENPGHDGRPRDVEIGARGQVRLVHGG